MAGGQTAFLKREHATGADTSGAAVLCDSTAAFSGFTAFVPENLLAGGESFKIYENMSFYHFSLCRRAGMRYIKICVTSTSGKSRRTGKKKWENI